MEMVALECTNESQEQVASTPMVFIPTLLPPHLRPIATTSTSWGIFLFFFFFLWPVNRIIYRTNFKMSLHSMLALWKTLVKENPLSGQNIWKYTWLLSVWKERWLEVQLCPNLWTLTNRLAGWSGTWKDKTGRLITEIWETGMWLDLLYSSMNMLSTRGHPLERRSSAITWIRWPIL